MGWRGVELLAMQANDLCQMFTKYSCLCVASRLCNETLTCFVSGCRRCFVVACGSLTEAIANTKLDFPSWVYSEEALKTSGAGAARAGDRAALAAAVQGDDGDDGDDDDDDDEVCAWPNPLLRSYVLVYTA